MGKSILRIVCGLRVIIIALASVCFYGSTGYAGEGDEQLRISTFDVDATPPVGSYLTYDVMTHTWDMGLRAKGIVISGAGHPIVLCSVDWIGIANEGQDEFKRVLAQAAGTIPDRVVVHTVHQHDAPTCDFSSEKLLKSKNLDPINFEGSFAREVIRRLDSAVRVSLTTSKPVTHVGLGEATVYKVASNRRIIDATGKVVASRTSSTIDSAIRALPEGLIDPDVSLISFWNNGRPLAVLSYYAVHPQSYYRTGNANPDFPGIARFLRQMAVPEALHVHFNGAGGDITAGKYNDGSKENRRILAERLADGMQRAWEGTKLQPVSSEDITWAIVPVAFTPSVYAEKLEEELESQTAVYLANNVYKLAWAKRLKEGKRINISCLGVGSARVLHLPGEPFLAYQLAAKAMRKDLFVAVAGYGDYATGYIGMAKTYEEGGYEAGPASGVTASAEKVLMDAMRELLQ